MSNSVKTGAIKYYINRFIDWIYFGKITQETKGYIAGCIAEIAYYGRGKKLIGYWAYGYYDPSFPYPRWLRREYVNKLKRTNP